MEYIESISGVQLNIYTTNTQLTPAVRLSIQRLVAKLRGHYSDARNVNVFLEEEGTKKVKITVGTQGQDVEVSGKGGDFIEIIDSLRQKLFSAIEQYRFEHPYW